MSGTAAAAGGMGGAELGSGGCRAPFTAVQWQELEQQAMVYKYLVAGLPIPPHLIMPIRRSFEAVSARFFHHPALGYYSYYGKKYDPEPGRCRRTDGKKWRCSKEAHSDSKYCERHMHRGRNRSRKHVESQSTSRLSSTVTSHISTGCGVNAGNFHGSGSGSFQRASLFSVDNLDRSSLGRNVTKLQVAVDKKDSRFFHGLTSNVDEGPFSTEASGTIGNLGLGSSAATCSWRPLPSQLSSFKQKSELVSRTPAQQHMPHAFQPIDAALSKQQQQCCLFGSDVGLPGLGKAEQHAEHVFFSEWPVTKDSWDENESNQTIFSSTQLSISIPRAASNCPPTSAYATNDG